MKIKSVVVMAMIFALHCKNQSSPTGKEESTKKSSPNVSIADILAQCKGKPAAADVCTQDDPSKGRTFVTCNANKQVSLVVLHNCMSWNFSEALSAYVQATASVTSVDVSADKHATTVPHSILSDSAVTTLCARQDGHASIDGVSRCKPRK